MKTKLIILIIIAVLIPIITFANMRLRQVDAEGRTIIYSSEDMNELEEGTKVSLAIPVNESISKEEKHEALMKEKNEDLKKSNSRTMSKKEEQSLKEDLDNYSNPDLENNTNRFKEILRKYYGEENANNLFNNIEKEIKENEGEYELPDSSKKMLGIAIDLLKENKVTQEEEKVIRYILEEIDTTFIEDEELLNGLKSIDVTLDKNN